MQFSSLSSEGTAYAWPSLVIPSPQLVLPKELCLALHPSLLAAGVLACLLLGALFGDILLWWELCSRSSLSTLLPGQSN